MAIDMIENNELGTFTEGRLGLNQFVDEGYKNYTGGEDFFNLFGSRKKRKSAFRDAVRKKYEKLPTDCDNIQSSINIVYNDLQTIIKRKQNFQQQEEQDETNLIYGELQNLALTQKCDEVRIQAQKAKEAESTLSTLTQITDTSVAKAKQELSGLQAGVEATKSNKNLLIYAGLGVAGLLIIALIIKNR